MPMLWQEAGLAQTLSFGRESDVILNLHSFYNQAWAHHQSFLTHITKKNVEASVFVLSVFPSALESS